jgi:molybdopterin molybdotransferase
MPEERMLKIDEAARLIMESITPLEAEEVDLLESSGRFLASDIVSSEDIPPADNSAMDGYALFSEDVRKAARERPATLRIVNEVYPDHTGPARIQPGEAALVTTGAPIPTGADQVVRHEYTIRKGDTVTILREEGYGANIRPAGENIRAGSVVLRKGDPVGPVEMGLLASLGRVKVPVHRRPTVAVLSTGDEIVEPGLPLPPGKVRDSNRFILCGLVRRCGGIPRNLGIVRDDEDEIARKFSEGLEADVLVTSGGVSMGAHDFVRDVYRKLGVEIKFWKVAMKPGRPLAYGTHGSKPIFGLPGNPVAVAVSFEIFARPALLRLAGATRLRKQEVRALLPVPLKRRKGRVNLVRARVEYRSGRYEVSEVLPEGAGLLSIMQKANALLWVEEDLREGEEVKALLLYDPEVL